MPGQNRRVHARQRVVSLTYVDLGQSNGGIVLNVSETGIGIQAVEQLNDPDSVWLQLPSAKKRLEVRTKVAWIGPSRKEAGLRFIDLSEDTLKQIRTWIACEASPYAFGRHNGSYFFEPTPVPAAVAPDSVVQAGAKPVLNPESPAPPQQVAKPLGRVERTEEIKLHTEAVIEARPKTKWPKVAWDALAGAESETEWPDEAIEASSTESVSGSMNVIDLEYLERANAEAHATDSTAEETIAQGTSSDVDDAQDLNMEVAAFEALAIQDESDTLAVVDAAITEPNTARTQTEEAIAAKSDDIPNRSDEIQARPLAAPQLVKDEVEDERGLEAGRQQPSEIRTTESSQPKALSVKPVGALLAALLVEKDENAPGREKTADPVQAESPVIVSEARSARFPEIHNGESKESGASVEDEAGAPGPVLVQDKEHAGALSANHA